MTGNKLIFSDLTWQHRAYVASGILALKYVDLKDNSLGQFRLLAMDAWRQIDDGIKNGDTLGQNIIEGNQAILEREQQFVIQPVYVRIKAIQISLTVMIAGFPVSVPLPVNYGEILSILAKNPIPGGKDFIEIIPDGNLGNYADRWNWIQGDPNEGMYQIWDGSSATHGLTPRERLNQVRIPLSDRARSSYSSFPGDVP